MGNLIELEELRAKLKEMGNAEIAAHSKRYLKSPYDFYGIPVPQLRKVAKELKSLNIYDSYNLFDELWSSGNHEEMSLGIFILQNQKKKYNLETWSFLIKRLDRAKTWDHVDGVSGWILGEILVNNVSLNSEVKKMANSTNPWIRRTSIVSMLPLIRKNKLELTFLLCETLVYDSDIYVQKGAGWMIREAGKKNRLAARDFILRHLDMKATAFSYATEKMTELRKIKKEKQEAEKRAKEESKNKDIQPQQ
jgi:3-methyladenine DNA glycosylase AlkD